jgi:hypothetical protein
MTPSLRVLVGALACALLVAGCVRPRPSTAPPPPAPLEVPVVPPRVLAPVAVEPEEPAVAEEPAPTTPRRPTRPRPRPDATTARPDPQAHDAPKPDAPPVDAAPPPAETKPAEAKSVLQTPQTADDADAERRIRDVLGRAQRELAKVDTRSLGADARTQYETARRFVDQAGDALAARNYMFARYLAEKAEALARGLTGR